MLYVIPTPFAPQFQLGAGARKGPVGIEPLVETHIPGVFSVARPWANRRMSTHEGVGSANEGVGSNLQSMQGKHC